VRPLAVVGNLSLDRVDGGEPRPGGAPFHAARALRVLGRPALVAVKAADVDRRRLLPPLVRLGLPVLWRAGASTATFAFSYDGDRRAMLVEELGPSWTVDDLRGLERVEWVQVGALARSDFPAGTLASLARGRRKVALDGQGLTRPERPGPLVLDADYDPEVLRHVSVLKLAEEEAVTIVGETDEDALRSLDVPEVVVTLAGVRGGDARAGSRTPGRRRPDRGGRLVPRRLPRFAVGGLRAGRVGAPRDRSRRGPARAEVVRALVRTVDGVFEVDLDEEVVLGLADVEVEAEQVAVSLPLLVATAASGSTVIAVVDRRPPLVISNDAGSSWREAGGGLPPGRAVALAWDDPDYALYAARNRLYVSTNGGVFWRALALELPEIEAVALTA